MNRILKIIGMTAATIAVLFAPLGASAQQFSTQLNSGGKTVTLNLSIPESITLTLNVTSLNFTYSASSGGSATTPTTIVATTSWSLVAGNHTTVSTWAWFSSPSAALTGPASTNIPASEVFASIDGSSPSPCNATPAAFPSGVQSGGVCPGLTANTSVLWTSATATGTSTDNVILSMANLGALPAGSFVGTLNFEAFVS